VVKKSWRYVKLFTPDTTDQLGNLPSTGDTDLHPWDKSINRKKRTRETVAHRGALTTMLNTNPRVLCHWVEVYTKDPAPRHQFGNLFAWMSPKIATTRCSVFRITCIKFNFKKSPKYIHIYANWTLGHLEPRTSGPSDKWTLRQVDPRTTGQVDLRTTGPSDKWTHGQVDPQTNGPSDKWTLGQVDPQTTRTSDNWVDSLLPA